MTDRRRRAHIDICALQRPFDRADDLPEDEQEAVAARFAAEVEALEHVLQRSDLVATPAHYAEAARCQDEPRRNYMEALLRTAPIQVPLAPLTLTESARLTAIRAAGIKERDAYHLMYAEAHADVLITVDADFLTKATKIGTIPACSLTQAQAEIT